MKPKPIKNTALVIWQKKHLMSQEKSSVFNQNFTDRELLESNAVCILKIQVFKYVHPRHIRIGRILSRKQKLI